MLSLEAAQIFFDFFFEAASVLGSPVVWIIASAVLYWQGKEKESFFLMSLVVVSGVAVGYLKNFFKIPRPAGYSLSSLESLLGSFSFDRFSFPSGHATIISSVYGFYREKMKKHTEFFFLALVVAVAYSRVYLGVHFPIDVVSGMLLGFVIGRVFSLFFERFLAMKKEALMAKEELFLVIGGFFLAALFVFFESFPVMGLIAGYYLGLLAFKLLGFDSTQVKGRMLAKKAFLGLIGLFVPLSLVLAFPALKPFEKIGLFFLAGFWITFVFPFLFEKALKKQTSKV